MAEAAREPGRRASRRYAGQSVEERRARRRRLLVDAARELWRDQGWSGVTMRGVCAAAGLTDRYFYESFADRDELLAVVWDSARDEVLTLLLGHVPEEPGPDPFVYLNEVIDAIVRDVAANPLQIEILFGDHAGSSVLQARRRDSIAMVTDAMVALAAPYLVEDADHDALRMSTLLGIGGFVELVQAWRSGIIDTDAAAISAHLHAVALELGAPFVRMPPG